MPGVGTFKATMISAGIPTVFVNAEDIGYQGTELREAINGDPAQLARFEQIRVAGALRIGPALPVAGDAAIDEAWIELGQRGVAEPEPVHDTGAKALDQRVGAGRQAPQQRAAFRLLEVDAQAFLVAIDELVEIAGVTRHRPHRADIVAGAGVLDLDHLGAVIGEVLGGERAGQQTGEIEDAQAGERGRGRISARVHLIRISACRR